MRRCAYCWYFSEGFCHRNPPIIRIGPGDQLGSMFIPVGNDNFCGEWCFDIGKWWRGARWEPARTG